MARQQLNNLIAQSVQLLLEAGIISSMAWEKAAICPDGMLHEAASSLRCAQVTASCYEVTSADHPRSGERQAGLRLRYRGLCLGLSLRYAP